MARVFVLLGGLFEVGFTSCLRYADGFRNIPWTLGFLTCAALSFLFLDMATRNGLPLGTAYAVWTGFGALGTVVIGMIWFQEPANLLRGLLILGMVACVAGLKFTSGH